MKNTCLILSLILLVASQGFAQLTIGSNTVTMGSGTVISTGGDILLNSTARSFGESEWHLVGGDQQVNVANSDLATFHRLYINGGGDKRFNGNFEISDQLHLIEGIVVIPTSNLEAFKLNSPSVVQDGHSADSYVEGMLQINTGDKSSAVFPVGNGTYTPVVLTNISGSSPILGVDANNEGIGTIADLPEQVNDYSINWNWELALFTDASTFNAATITIPLTEADRLQFGEDDYRPIVLFQNTNNATGNLDNASGDAASNTDRLITAKDMAREGRYFTGKTLVFNPIVHNVITPNGDNTNDYLVIDNLEFFPENEIIILDRYGIEVYAKSNYVSPDADSADGEDFTFLPPGNYICILRYNNGANTIKQTISVIK